MVPVPFADAGDYVAGAYVVFLALILVYVGIMAAKLRRIEREVEELAEVVEQRKAEEERAEQPAEVTSP